MILGNPRAAVKLIYIVIVIIVFGVLYTFLCNKSDFGGLNIIYDTIRERISEKIVEDVNDKIIEEFYNNNNNNNNSEISRKIVKDITQTVIEDKESKDESTFDRFFDMIYFSASTIGFGDIYPITRKTKLIVIAQILCIIFIIFVI
jgi:hypothetical protein